LCGSFPRPTSARRRLPNGYSNFIQFYEADLSRSA
jgi:hypothetical protein